MEIDFKQTLKNLDESISKDEKGEIVTLKKLCINALFASIPNEKIDGIKKMERYDLGMKIKNDKKEFKIEEIALIKKLVGQVYGTFAVGQIYNMLEGDKDGKTGKN